MTLEEELWLNLALSISEMNCHRITNWSQYQQMNIQCLIRNYGDSCKAELGRSGNPTTMLHLTLNSLSAKSVLAVEKLVATYSIST